MEPLRYLAVLVACLLVTLPLEFVLGARVLRRPRRLALVLLAATAPFVVWDLVALARGHWSFAPGRTVGLTVAGLPVEELLFFVVVPVCALLTYEALGLPRRGSRDR
ncbi:lycopene cyclase [Pilimelia terevasa]|uniref:Lycopene cyclase n=1 Tax=Pilimelia terevasa TaxID=53372 RepID=A0A8J3BLH9_9ACTN|nr:lycopene cyclase domain-containing protein [Pilimelia terevasa]GGK12437.1 lycopene cyclase [Pilimelia terevasa]